MLSTCPVADGGCSAPADAVQHAGCDDVALASTMRLYRCMQDKTAGYHTMPEYSFKHCRHACPLNYELNVCSCTADVHHSADVVMLVMPPGCHAEDIELRKLYIVCNRLHAACY
jgi:hypothetical protein